MWLPRLRAVTVTCSLVPASSRYSASISTQNGYPCWPCGALRSSTELVSCRTAVHAIQRVRPWMAFTRAGSVRPSWYSVPPKT